MFVSSIVLLVVSTFGSAAAAVPQLAVSEPEAGGTLTVWVRSDPYAQLTILAAAGQPLAPAPTVFGGGEVRLDAPEVLGTVWTDAQGYGLASFPVPIGAPQGPFSAVAAMGNSVSDPVTSTVLAPGDDPDQDGLGAQAEALAGTSPSDPDSDGDGLSDGFEVAWGGFDPARLDTDFGGAADGLEYALGTDPQNPLDDPGAVDTDGDGLPDPVESLLHTDPWRPDTDWDSLSDGFEYITSRTDPTRWDTDSDGLSDGDEVGAGTDPRDADSDDGGANDGEEAGSGTDPHAPQDDDHAGADWDGDGLPDRLELLLGTVMFGPDSDGDNLTDGDEYFTTGTDPTRPDTDWDGLDDHTEWVGGTDPTDADTDHGGATDLEELQSGTDPHAPQDDVHAGHDFDGDGIPTRIEQQIGTLYFLPDCDGDLLTDGEEYFVTGTDPLDSDTDGDGLDDRVEWFGVTDPHDADSDDGGATDGEESLAGTDPNASGDDERAGSDFDGDGLPDRIETLLGSYTWIADSDADLLLDGEEYFLTGTDLLSWDTDGGGESDGAEVLAGRDPLSQVDDQP